MAITHFPNDRAVTIKNVYWRGTLEVISFKSLSVALAQVSHGCAKVSVENPQEPGFIVSLDTILQCGILPLAWKYFFPVLGKKRYESYSWHTRDYLCQSPLVPGKIPESEEAKTETPQRQASTLFLVQLLLWPAHTGTAEDALQLHACDLVNVFERERKKKNLLALQKEECGISRNLPRIKETTGSSLVLNFMQMSTILVPTVFNLRLEYCGNVIQMTCDWEAARPTDLWNFLFMFRFNKNKINLSCVAFLHSSVRKCSRKIWKVSVKHTWTCLQTDQKAEACCSSGGSCHFLVFPQLNTPWLFFPPRGKRGECWLALHLLQSLNPFTRRCGEEAYILTRFS